MTSRPPTSRWNLNYNATASSSTLPILNPPGYRPSTSSTLQSRSGKAIAKQNETTETSNENVLRPDLKRLRAQKAWDLAIAPAKNVPMQAFMMYMTGGGVQIFSIMSVWFLLKGAVMGMMNVQSVFAGFAPPVKEKDESGGLPPLFYQKSTYFVCQLALLSVGLWKCYSIGLLDYDSLAFKERDGWIA